MSTPRDGYWVILHSETRKYLGPTNRLVMTVRKALRFPSLQTAKRFLTYDFPSDWFVGDFAILHRPSGATYHLLGSSLEDASWRRVL
jgi:hypothetical protein